MTKLNVILGYIFTVCLAIFEFIIDILITFICIYILNTCFDDNIIITIISWIILLSGLTYAFNDIIITFKETNNDSSRINK